MQYVIYFYILIVYPFARQIQYNIPFGYVINIIEIYIICIVAWSTVHDMYMLFTWFN